MNKEILLFQLGKIQVCVSVIERLEKLFAGYPQIARSLATAKYDLNRASLKIDEMAKKEGL